MVESHRRGKKSTLWVGECEGEWERRQEWLWKIMGEKIMEGVAVGDRVSSYNGGNVRKLWVFPPKSLGWGS